MKTTQKMNNEDNINNEDNPQIGDLDSHSTTDPKPEMLSVVSTGNIIQRDERNVHGIEHSYMLRKDNILEKGN